jgi:hypothetical protein
LVHSLADLEYLDPDHLTLTVEIKHDNRRNLFGADGFETFWPKTHKREGGPGGEGRGSGF